MPPNLNGASAASRANPSADDQRLRANSAGVDPGLSPFLLAWQRVSLKAASKSDGLVSVIEQLEAFEAPVAAWTELLFARVAEYDPEWLDRAGFPDVSAGQDSQRRTARGRARLRRFAQARWLFPTR